VQLPSKLAGRLLDRHVEVAGIADAGRPAHGARVAGRSWPWLSCAGGRA
jgi:hypothetical protein